MSQSQNFIDKFRILEISVSPHNNFLRVTLLDKK